MRTIWIAGYVACLSLVSIPVAQATVLLGPTPYLAFDNTLPGAGTAISPFSGLVVDDYFHNETFEDGLPLQQPVHTINTPGLSLFPGFFGSIPNSITDSVDADDGVIDGSGSTGKSFFSSNGNKGLRFQFSSVTLGALPTHAGLVWTDGQVNAPIRFEAFGATNESLGVIIANGIPGNFFTGQTDEDRFFGAFNAAGISSIMISMNSLTGGGIEVDHVQYGRLSAPNATVPEPASVVVWGVIGLLGVYARRRAVAL